ncbi:tRNA (cytidine(56)-2'-O)-methyltransferase [Candidatus Bathyarchaeota archaeon]|nr:tRNA (cytidine(56)-2'-O)-methyltransferase [Candidatus Bathyarchaeota archaeon]
MKVEVLRLDHRYIRDVRITTHLFLTARAFGASKVTYSGQRDEKLEERMKEITRMWGGPFNVLYEENWKQAIEKWKERDGEVIHLTFYGLPVQDILHDIRCSIKDKLIIVGGSKVPRIVYNLSDWNISITSQTHSEISALSVFLHELFQGRELLKVFKNAKLKIIPQSRGKKVLEF